MSLTGAIRTKQPHSLTFRLTTLYALGAVLVLLVCGAILYWFLIRSFQVEDSRFLAAKVHELHTDFLADNRRTGLLVGEIGKETKSPHFREYYARVISRDSDTVVGATPGMKSILPRGRFPSAQPYDFFETHPHVIMLKRGKTYMLASTVLGFDSLTHKPVILQLAADITRDTAVLTDFRDTLLAVLGLAIFMSAAFGAWAARRGLSPLRAITHAVAGVSAERLDRRIGSETRWPRELEGLATAFDGMLDRLDQSFRRLRQFSADVAHELRTPLNNLRGEAEVALSAPRSGDEYKRVLESVLEEQVRLSKIVESLLFLARAEQHREPINPRKLDLASLLTAVLDYYRPLAEEKRIELIARGTGALYADPDLLQRALSNLISNAIQHTPPDGKIVASIEEKSSDELRIEIRDTGNGIPPEHLPRLFDRFYRVDASRASGAEGSGLGLAIVQSIMVLHAGSVDVTSQLHKGTRVLLRFPKGKYAT